jgi:hypothetical protein
MTKSLNTETGVEHSFFFNKKIWDEFCFEMKKLEFIKHVVEYLKKYNNVRKKSFSYLSLIDLSILIIRKNGSS